MDRICGLHPPIIDEVLVEASSIATDVNGSNVEPSSFIVPVFCHQNESFYGGNDWVVARTAASLTDAAVSDSLHLSLGIPFKRARFPGLGTAKMHHRQLSNYLMHVCNELRNSQRPREKITTRLCMCDSVNVTQAIQTCPPLKMLHKC